MKHLLELFKAAGKDKLWLGTGIAIATLIGIFVLLVSKDIGYALIGFGATFAYTQILGLIREDSRGQREKESKAEFQKTFGLTPSLAATVRATVIQRLIESQRALNVIVASKDSVARKWEEASLETVDGVEQRLTLQREYDEANSRLQKLKQQFERVCEVALDAGFREEVRAFGYPRVTVKIPDRGTTNNNSGTVAATTVVVMG